MSEAIAFEQKAFSEAESQVMSLSVVLSTLLMGCTRLMIFDRQTTKERVKHSRLPRKLVTRPKAQRPWTAMQHTAVKLDRIRAVK
jgi:hypothetical protein